MIIDFKSIKHDFYGKVEQPVLSVKTLDGRIITTISNYHGLKPTFRFNDLSEVEFSVPAFHDGKRNKGYDEIIGMRLVEVEPFGDFILVNPEKENSGGKKELKICKAYSLEYAFNYKKVDIAAGTYNFYNPLEQDNENTIMKMIIDLMPDWSIGEVDKEFIGRWRTFDNVDENLYGFMMNTLQESYNCLFLFDTKKKKINVKSAERSTYKLPIYLSYQNLIKNVKITELSEDIVTALAGYGSGDEVNIRAVNPNGSNVIYNLDYFISNGDIPEPLASKWVTYKDSLELHQQIFSNLQVLRIQKSNELNLSKSEYITIETAHDIKNTEYLTWCSKESKNPYDKKKEPKQYALWPDEWEDKRKKLYNELEKLKKDLESQNTQSASINAELAIVESQMKEITDICSIDSYFTKKEIQTLSQYFKHDSIADDTFVIPEYGSSAFLDASKSLTSINDAILKITGAAKYATNVATIFGTDDSGNSLPFIVDEESGELVYNGQNDIAFHESTLNKDIAETIAKQYNDSLNKSMYEFRGGKFNFKYSAPTSTDEDEIVSEYAISGDIVNVDLEFNNSNLSSYDDKAPNNLAKAGHFMLTATLRNAEYKGSTYPSLNFSIQGFIEKRDKSSEELNITNRLITLTDIDADCSDAKIEIDSATFSVTASNTETQKQSILQELYDYVEESLKELSMPSYEFSVESGNFVFAEEFEPFKDQLELGCTITLSLNDDEDDIIQPILIEIGLNYDDESDFTILFSNKYHSSSSEFKLADLISEMDRQTRSAAINKADYRSYKDSEAGNQISNLTTSAIDVVRNKVINSANQSVEWNSSGMFFRKLIANNVFDDRQIGIVNENIVFTKDGFKTLDIAIGAYTDPNTGEGYGIIAPSIFGTLIAGENLVIENTVENDVGATVKQFRVDSTGAWLHNSSLAFTQESDVNTGKGGGKILIDPRYGIAAGNADLFTIKDTDVVPSFWDIEEDKIKWDENEVLVTDDGSRRYYVPLNTQFFFDINTGNAYFSGTISGKNIIAQTINGSAIADETLDASSKLTGNINVAQMEKNVLASVLAYIEKENEANKELTETEKLSAKLVEAINLSAGQIDANKINVSSLTAEGIVVQGEKGKLAITPEYGIIAGNSELFSLDDETGKIIPSFVDNDGQLIVGSNGIPKNTTFYFDSNTGNAYFGGTINGANIIKGSVHGNAIQTKTLSAETIYGGDITADVMTANIVTAINTKLHKAEIDEGNFDIASIDSARIEAAIIKDLTAEMITSGVINTSNIGIRDEDGGLVIVGNTVQWFEGSGDDRQLRMQAGQDAQGNFNFAIFGLDKDGKSTVTLMDQDGIKSSAIPDGSITTEMVAADLSAEKIAVDSLFDVINGEVEKNVDKDELSANIIHGALIDAKTLKAEDIQVDKLQVNEGFTVGSPETLLGYLLSTEISDEFDEITGEKIGTAPVGIIEKVRKEAQDSIESIDTMVNGEVSFEKVAETDDDGNPLLDDEGNVIYKKIPELDDDGNPVLDADGNIVYKKVLKTDENGNPVLDDDGNPMYDYEYEEIAVYKGGIFPMVAGINSTVEQYTQSFSELSESVKTDIEAVFEELSALPTREEIAASLSAATDATVAGVADKYGSFFKHVDINSLDGLVIHGIDFERDEEGNILYNTKERYQYIPKLVYEKVPETDEDGNPVLDENGNVVYKKVPETDEDGNPVLDENGDIVYKKTQMFDEDGNPVLDEDGNPVYEYEYEERTDGTYKYEYQQVLDEDGNPILDEDLTNPKCTVSDYTVNITNTSFAIKHAGETMAEIYNSEMKIDNINTTSSMRIGDYTFRVSSSGSKVMNFNYEPL